VGVAAPILAHAFAGTSTPKVEMVGTPAVFASASSSGPSTALPSGTAKGDFLVSYIETLPSSAISCGNGWVKRLDAVNGTATRLVACTRLQTDAAPLPRAAVAPAEHVSMVTMAFHNVDLATPVGAAASNLGLTGPTVHAVAGSMMALAQGSSHWRVTFDAPTTANKVAATNDGAASELAAAIDGVDNTVTAPSGRWSRSAAATTAASTGSGAKAAAATAADAALSGPTSITAAVVLNPASAPPSTSTSVGSTTTVGVTTTTTVVDPPPDDGGAPTKPPAFICGNDALLDGPATAPAGAMTVPAGDNKGIVWKAGTTYWFAPGVHTLGTGIYDQIIPADNDTFIGAPGAVIDGQGKNYFAFTQHASGVTIKYLTIRNFVALPDQGVVNHDSGNGWTITNNSIVNNKGAGMMAGANQVVRYNCLADNGQYAINAYQAGNGIANIVIDHNEISGNNTGDWERVIPGCGCTGGLKLWAVRGAQLTNNYVHDNRGVGLWADMNNVGVEISGNYIADNDGEGVMYEASYNASIHDNTFLRNAWLYGPKNPGFPVGAIYVSESGGDSRVSSKYSTFEIAHNVFTDNWSGVILWENADRFCNSPANPSKDCTQGGAATLATCVSGKIDNEPYYTDCRWKTQHVAVHDNTFSLDASKVPQCTLAVGCGYNGLFSQWGTYPSWSPYTEERVEDAVTFRQANVFARNTYHGPWKFMAHDQATRLTLFQWQAAPYRQDAGSTME
jgi:hypothetical protein